MAKEHILVVEDEEDILELVRYNLSREGFHLTGVTCGEEGLKTARNMGPDLILLDLMLPGMDGLEVCRVLKHDGKTQYIPIVILTAKGEEADIVAGLELGADDYITKPFSPRVLIARVRAVLRRRAIEPPGETSPLTIHELAIHPGRHEVMVAGQPVDLTVTEFRLLHMLARRPGWVFTRTQIINGVHGDDYPVSDRSIDVQIVGLRKKLGSAGNYIETVRGVGYRFKE
ncbi:MAG: response regulator transcription factor [Deltaproteobacteria bacterium]|nr:response regulator transcription factor [Deltaproteobacteria bacterium]MBW1952041.1 response regulator transcription factor [Deltaproteobacteria bacterium]MBW1986934.1 response regulator transcription factor [Deltaproteobacteria bacterium]MBW2134077.1 response regulator transcription factor [Deltaproteobacteria bacterium]